MPRDPAVPVTDQEDLALIRRTDLTSAGVLSALDALGFEDSEDAEVRVTAPEWVARRLKALTGSKDGQTALGAMRELRGWVQMREKLVTAALDAQRGQKGSTHGGKSLDPDMGALLLALEKVPPANRREILAALSGARVIDAEVA